MINTGKCTNLSNLFLINRGLSFVQILIAVAVLGIAVLPVLSVFFSGTRTVREGGAYLEAAMIAQSIMDQVKNINYLTRNTDKTIVLSPDNSDLFELPTRFLEKYSGSASISIRRYDDGQFNNLFVIDVKVDWTENYRDQSLTLSSYQANIQDVKFFELKY